MNHPHIAASRSLELQPSTYIANRWPHFLPDGDHFLYLADSPPGGQSALRVGSLRGRDSRSVLEESRKVST